MGTKKHYDERTDIEKVNSQWHKLSGLHTREEWSAAVVRAATAAELAATLAVRKEFENRSTFSREIVDSFLKWANGLDGKMTRLIFPLMGEPGRKNQLKLVKKLYADIKLVADKRNDIVHRGHFCNEEEATQLIAACKAFILGIVGMYYDDFELVERKRSKV